MRHDLTAERESFIAYSIDIPSYYVLDRHDSGECYPYICSRTVRISNSVPDCAEETLKVFLLQRLSSATRVASKTFPVLFQTSSQSLMYSCSRVLIRMLNKLISRR